MSVPTPDMAAEAPADDMPPPTPWATYFLAASWVLIYGAMLAVQGSFPLDRNPLRFGGIRPETAHAFGDLSARAFAAGQVWRTITATFIHAGLLHLVINAIGLVQFGRVLEEWYGSSLFLAIYVAIAAAGNSLAAGSRLLLNQSLDVPAAGGSSVLFGLVGLIFVAGWRMKSRDGDSLRRQMLWKLIVYGVLAGIVGQGVLDNFGHAGGAIAGACVGFADPTLFRIAGRRSARMGAAVAAVVLALSLAAQANTATAEARAVRRQRVFQNVALVGVLVDQVERLRMAPGPFLSDPTTGLRQQFQAVLAALDRDTKAAGPPASPEEYRRWRRLAGEEASGWLKPSQVAEFGPLHRAILEAAFTRAAGRANPAVAPRKPS